MTTPQRSEIEKHGRILLTIFPNATERDPVKLCKKLRRLEAKAQAIALRLCNGPEYPNEHAADDECYALLLKVNTLLDFIGAVVPVFINRDPRGYALKIDEEWMREHARPLKDSNRHTVVATLHRDCGGYGILAPKIKPTR